MKTYILPLAAIFFSLALYAQPVPDCAKTERRLFMVSKQNLLCTLGQYNAVPSSIGQWETCFKVEHWKMNTNDTGRFFSFKIYPIDTPWPPEKYAKVDSSMTIIINTKQLPDSFNYYLEITYAKGRYCVNINDSTRKIISVSCCMGYYGKKANAIDITPAKWIECKDEKQSLKKNKSNEVKTKN